MSGGTDREDGSAPRHAAQPAAGHAPAAPATERAAGTDADAAGHAPADPTTEPAADAPADHAPAEPAGGPGDLAAFYADGYTQSDPLRADLLGRWRALGARSKADHAVALLARAALDPARVVEIGCGDGALLAEVSARGVGASLDGFELSGPAAALAAGRGVPRAGRIEAFDGAHVPAPDDAYDLAVLSHVAEHVPDPAPLLREAARVAPWVLVEVPLEANRSAARLAKRAEAARIGHLHAFDREAVRALLRTVGLVSVHELADPLPRAHLAFFAAGPWARASATAKWAVRAAAHRIRPEAAEKLFTVHFAVLARRSSAAHRAAEGPAATR